MAHQRALCTNAAGSFKRSALNSPCTRTRRRQRLRKGVFANAAASEGTVRGGTWSAALPPSSPEGPGPVQSKRLSTHISARRFLQIMSLGPRRDLKQESLHLIRGRPNTGGKDLSAHHIIDRDPDEIVGNETQKRFQPGRGDPWKATAMLTYDNSYANLRRVLYPITLLIECDVFVGFLKMEMKICTQKNDQGNFKFIPPTLCFP